MLKKWGRLICAAVVSLVIVGLFAGQHPAHIRSGALRQGWHAKPGSNFILGSTTPLTQSESLTDQATRLKSAIHTAFSRLDTLLEDSNFTEGTNYLQALQGYQYESLLLMPRLAHSEKISLAQACADHAANLEIILHILPVDSRMDGMMVEAGCAALREAAQ